MNKFSLQIPDVTEKTKYYFLAGIVLLVILFDYVFIMRMQINALASLRPKVSELSKDFNDTQYNLERISLYQSEVAKLRGKLKETETSILTREEIPMALEKISRLAGNFDIQIDQIMPLKESQELVLDSSEGKFFALPIFIKALGSYHDIGHFFNKIETNEIFMNIQDFSITQNSNFAKKQFFTIAITVFVVEKPKKH